MHVCCCSVSTLHLQLEPSGVQYTCGYNVMTLFQHIAVAAQDGGQPRFAVADLQAQLEPLLKGLFGAFQQPESAENEYIMKCVMRLITFVGPQVTPPPPPLHTHSHTAQLHFLHTDTHEASATWVCHSSPRCLHLPVTVLSQLFHLCYRPDLHQLCHAMTGPSRVSLRSRSGRICHPCLAEGRGHVSALQAAAQCVGLRTCRACCSNV